MGFYKTLFGTVITISIMIWCIENGHFLWWFLGVMLLGIYRNREWCKTYWKNWKIGMKAAWNRGGKKWKTQE